MSETRPKAVVEDRAGAGLAAVSIGQIFLEFLIIGATSFGGVVPYLRGSLVTKRQWIDDREFVEMLSISQSLPGLNATNMAILRSQSSVDESRDFLPAEDRRKVKCSFRIGRLGDAPGFLESFDIEES
jgi:hypothetical protein